jgi:hypothetical protein
MGVMMMGTDDLVDDQMAQDDENLLEAVRRRLGQLQDARLLRNLSVSELTEHDELLRLEKHLLRRGH